MQLKSLKIFSFNCRSIRSKISHISEYLLDCNIDIALLQETWLRKSDSALVTQLEEYNFNVLKARKPRAIDKGGGVALLSKRNYKIQQLKTEQLPSFEHVTGKVKTNKGTVFISTNTR